MTMLRAAVCSCLATVFATACGPDPAGPGDEGSIDATALGGVGGDGAAGGSGTGAGTGGSGTTPRNTDSCEFDGYDICYEVTDVDEGEQWCAELAEVYGIPTIYQPACREDWSGACDDFPLIDDMPEEATSIAVYFYEPSWDPDYAEETCISNGGTPR